MNRELWKTTFRHDSSPKWSCPKCGRGRVCFSTDSPNYSERIERIDEWADGPEDWFYLFTTWLECSDRDCHQTFLITGRKTIESEYDEGMQYAVLFFNPIFFYPMPDIIELPDEGSEEFRETIKDAFSLFWSHPDACASRIRVAIEYLLDDLGVPRKGTNGGKIGLNDRIDKLNVTHQLFPEKLHAVKWLGNSGSHSTFSSKIRQTDLLNAFEIIEYILEWLKQTSKKLALKTKESRVEELSDELNKRYEP